MNLKPDFLDLILNTQEWQFFECKRAKAQPSKLLESIIAFANAEGGILVVGLEDPDKARGLQRLFGISENLNNVSDLLNLIPKDITPPIANISWQEFEIINNKHQKDKLVIFYIPRSTDVHSLKRGDTYLRYGRTNRRLTAQEIIQLKYAKGSITFENEPAFSASLEDLNKELLEKYQMYVGSTTKNIWQFLKDNGLTVKRENREYLNIACVLLFAENPTITLKRKCGIKITHYWGIKPNLTGEPNFYRRPFTIEGPLIAQIQQSLKYIQEWIKNAPPILRGATFKSKFRYPIWVLQEAITNAVIHRDYSIQNDIQIRIFDNRIEIENPGVLPGHITVSNLRQERFARNPIILRTLNRFGEEAPNLDIGEGVDRMFKLMKEANLYDPIYLVPPATSNSVLLVLLNLERISHWDTVSQYLDKNFKITNKELRNITGIKDTLKGTRLLKSWVKEGLLEEVKPSKKTTFYKKPGVKLPKDLFS